MNQVHLIFKTHLDLGFTDFARTVRKRYLEEFIPKALDLAEKSRQEGPDRFIWTTGSWLIYEYLEHADRTRMERAIEAGDIVWHALPFTTHTELLDPSLLRLALGRSQALDRRFGRKTTAAKMTDVPGHTRSMIPVLADAGVRLLHIGVNPACTVPDVPPIFRWIAPDGSEITVIYEHSYGDVVAIPGTEHAVAISFTGDNMGPHSLDSIHSVYEGLQATYPQANVQATSLEQVADDVALIRDSLPIITQEIGDTWVHGVGTDPTKVRRFKELSRLRQEWIADGTLEEGGDLDQRFGWPLIQVAEHTWGMDEKTHLDDYRAYQGVEFSQLRQTERCRQFEFSWDEQRAYIDEAVSALENTRLQAIAHERLVASEPQAPDLAAFELLSDPYAPLETERFRFAICDDGSITSLYDKAHRVRWGGRLCEFGYQAFDDSSYKRFLRQYVTHRYDWAIKDLSKPGIELMSVPHGMWPMRLRGVYRSLDRFLIELSAHDDAPVGCPRKAYSLVEFSENEPSVNVDFQWFGKEASRLPEALWLGMRPTHRAASEWMLHKLGQEVSPLDVVRNGNRKLHAIDQFVTCRHGLHSLQTESLDAPLVAPGVPSLLDFNNRPPRMKEGITFNLYNNVWGTNFPMWFSDDARFRFHLSFGVDDLA